MLAATFAHTSPFRPSLSTEMRVEYAQTAQDFYVMPPEELSKIKEMATLRRRIYERLPIILDEFTKELQIEMQSNWNDDAEYYRTARLLYDSLQPFFDKVKHIEYTTITIDAQAQRVHESSVRFLLALKEYMQFLEAKFAALDQPQFISRHFTPVTESALWEMRTKNRPYVL